MISKISEIAWIHFQNVNDIQGGYYVRIVRNVLSVHCPNFKKSIQIRTYFFYKSIHFNKIS